MGHEDEQTLARDHRTRDRIVGEAVTSRRLVAFFGCLYYSALRPSEALALHVGDLDLPPDDVPADTWGQLILARSNPEIATRWTDDGRRRARQLKHRARGTVRPVPCPPDLVALLRAHLKDLGPAPDGRLFYGPVRRNDQQRHLQRRVGTSPPTGTHPGRAGITLGGQALRPPAHRGLRLARLGRRLRCRGRVDRAAPAPPGLGAVPRSAHRRSRPRRRTNTR